MLNLHLLNKILLAIAKFSSSLTFTLLSFVIASSTYARAESISALPSETTDIAQRIDVPNIPPQDIPRPLPPPQPEPTPPEVLPPASDLLPKTPNLPPAQQPSNPLDTIFVREFEIVGNTILTQEISELVKEYTGQNLTFAELFAVRSKISELYVKGGYVTSAAIIPPQTLENGIVKIQIIEGSLEDIEIIGTRRLQPNYVRSRIKVATNTPLNINRLLEGLRVLQLDPLIANISADLQAGTSPGKNLLQVSIIEAKTLSITPSIDNARSPSVGSFRRQVGFNQANLLGFGDKLNLGYTNTDGSNEINVGYTIPLNPRNGTLRLGYGKINSNVIEPAFKELDIEADSSYYELSYRQPLLQRSREEFAVGLTLSQQQNQTSLGIDNIGGFPLSPGADDNGRTRISAVRFFQDWVKRDERQVIAARSQFSLGLNLFDATINNDAPDSRFFAWRGQAQWTRLLAADTLLLVRGDVQLADSSLVPFEQFGIGGQQTVRGCQDALLADNGVLFSTEFRIPILKAKGGGLLQLTPFIDIGTGWNNGESNLSEDTLIGTGLGLLWQQGSLSARIDYGIPLISVDTDQRTLQDNGIYFSIGYSPSF
ncbi:ShlB/FhaC/HecB family hemolysin secretion/activation protein [Plectonema cf. radiosum LEGE 06105]|uniref:ShlB/FhaC/HecB family hemolysin secretion/activation protein n=1 Tax=Plectonema cf. radiosum LEGE 06105 TaxID=945769 RepID=A0A8J7FBX9_9CYAN|nr:ShlB/FhaC/HecB family hemolysin secretion/activation protein [Plectonema radiosum]MBE9215539.1 ShlB/FhaC/HecB family hemolysin secretion/activation protein [Plectonema cf. radiosum LEGE 06105]